MCSACKTTREEQDNTFCPTWTFNLQEGGPPQWLHAWCGLERSTSLVVRAHISCVFLIDADMRRASLVTIPAVSWSNARPRPTRSTRRCAAEQRVSARSKAVEDHQKHFGYPRRAICGDVHRCDRWRPVCKRTRNFSNETRPFLVSKDTVESPATVGSLPPRVHMTVTLPQDIKPERKRVKPSRHVSRASFSVDVKIALAIGPLGLCPKRDLQRARRT